MAERLGVLCMGRGISLSFPALCRMALARLTRCEVKVHSFSSIGTRQQVSLRLTCGKRQYLQRRWISTSACACENCARGGSRPRSLQGSAAKSNCQHLVTIRGQGVVAQIIVLVMRTSVCEPRPQQPCVAVAKQRGVADISAAWAASVE